MYIPPVGKVRTQKLEDELLPCFCLHGVHQLMQGGHRLLPRWGGVRDQVGQADKQEK